MDVTGLFRLEGKVAIVTGGASRFGRPISEALAEAGATVIIASRSIDECEKLAQELCARGLKAHAQKLDLTSDESIKSLAEDTVERFGKIDILVNNAVLRGSIGEVDTLSREVMMRSLDVNFTAQLLMAQAVLPVMQAAGSGNIIFVSSTSALMAPAFSILPPGQMNPANYMMEKCGINGLTVWMAARYGKQGIRVNALCPSVYNPDAMADTETEPYREKYRNYTPLGRYLEPDEIKGPVLFLASEASSYCTGVILPVDGGYTL